jgi:nucleotide-binding universal stress UspA family protein
VLAHGRTPVLLVRPGGNPVSAVRTLLVPLDGSPGGAIALGIALGLSRATGAKLELVQVVVPFSAYAYAGDGFGGGGAFYWDPTWDDEALVAAKVYIDGMVVRLRHAGAVVDGRALMTNGSQSVATVINATAENVDADLVVMSTHALAGPVRALFGSVTEEVVRTGHRGALLIRRDAPYVDQMHRDVPATHATDVALASASVNPAHNQAGVGAGHDAGA